MRPQVGTQYGVFARELSPRSALLPCFPRGGNASVARNIPSGRGVLRLVKQPSLPPLSRHPLSRALRERGVG